MSKLTVLIALAAVLMLAAFSGPVCALNVYSNPSTQTSNVSPDGTYNEGNSMQVVSDKFVSKCAARGFGTRDSNWLSLAAACTDAVNWGANAFIAEHTDAAGAGGWDSNCGTHGLYWSDSGGGYDANDRDLCVKTVDNCISQFAISGRGNKWRNGYDGDWQFYGYHLYVTNNTPNMNTVLIEGLFHTNSADTALIKTDTGKNEYAQGLYQGVCSHYGYSYTTLNSAFNNQSYTAALKGGQQATCWVEYTNNGSETWYQGGANPVHLGTWSPQDRSSVFYTAGNWLNASRPSDLDQASVAPGGIGRFTFVMTAPVGNYGYKQEYWKLVAESKAWFGYEGVWFGVTTSAYDLVVDNPAATFTGTWSTGTSSADKYGADYRNRSTAALTDTATWTFSITKAGNYDVYAWWPQGANRSTTAPYKVNYNGGSATVNKNQQTGGGAWNLLGRWNFVAGNNTIQLGCNTTTGFQVMADATRMVGPY